MIKTAFNTTDQPVIVSGDGRQIGAREWGPVDTTSDEVKDLLDRSLLVLVERPEDDAQLDPAAVAAFDATDAMSELASTAKEQLADLVDDPEGKSKDELVEEAARTSPRRGR